MKFKTTWVLAGILVLLGVGVYIFEIQGGKKRQAAKEKEEKILVFEKDQVESILLKSANGKFVAKRSGADQWTLEEPLKVPADKFAWNGFVDTLYDLKFSRVIAEKADDLVPYGLKDPARVVELTMKGGDKKVFHIGEDNPIGDSTFVSKGDSKVVLAPRHSITAFDKELKDLREKKLFTFDAQKTQEVELQEKGKKLVLKKDGAKWLIVTNAKKEEADSTKVTELLNTLNFLEVKTFVEEEPKDVSKYELKSPKIRVKVRDEKTTQLETWFGKKEADQIYVSKVSEKPVYQVQSNIMDRLSLDATKYVKKEEKKTPDNAKN